MIEDITPRNDRVLVKPMEEDDTRYGNIIVPDMGKEKPEMGEVVAVGPGRMSEFGQFINVSAKVGETVVVPKIGSIRVTIKGEEYYVVQDKEILATVKLTKNQNLDNEE